MAENPITWDDSFEMSQEAIGSYLVPDDYNAEVNDESNYIIFWYQQSEVQFPFYSSQNKYATVIFGESAEGSEDPFTLDLSDGSTWIDFLSTFDFINSDDVTLNEVDSQEPPQTIRTWYVLTSDQFMLLKNGFVTLEELIAQIMEDQESQ